MEQKSKQPEDRTDDIRYIRKRKIWGGISVAVLLALLVFLTIFLTAFPAKTTPADKVPRTIPFAAPPII